MNKLSLIVLNLFIVACCAPLPHHEISEEILLKDKVYLNIKADFIVETPEALKEVRLNADKLKFAMRLSLREHASTELEGRGKRSVQNACKAIARQVLDHPVKDIRIITYDFHSKTKSNSI